MRNHSKTASNTMDMTEGTPMKLILQFAIPLFIGTLFQQAYNFVDTMIVGQGLGEQAVAAVGVTTALYSVLVYFANGMNNGYGIVISRLFGSKDFQGLKRAVATMIILNVTVTVALTLFTLPLLKTFLHWLDTPEDIFSQAYSYIFVILVGMIATIGYNMGAGFMRAIGNSRTPLYFLILSCALNVVLDILFVIVRKTGVAGAAWATVIAEAVSAALCFLYIYKTYADFLPGKEDWKLERKLTGEMFSTGLSMGLMLSVFSLGSIVLQKGINSLGTQIITAHTASRRIYEMLMMPLSTVATANATFVGQNFGAGQYGRIRRTLKQVMGIELLWSLASVLLAYTAGRPLLWLLVGQADAVIMDNALLNLRVCTVFFFPLGVLLVMRNAIQPMGYKISPVISSAIELVVKILFCIMLVPKMGYMGVVITEPFIWVVCAVFLGVIYLSSNKKKYAEQVIEHV